MSLFSSFKNTIVGESLIRELESKGIQLNEEKKGFEERLQAEAEARKKEAEKNTVRTDPFLAYKNQENTFRRSKKPKMN